MIVLVGIGIFVGFVALAVKCSRKEEERFEKSLEGLSEAERIARINARAAERQARNQQFQQFQDQCERDRAEQQRIMAGDKLATVAMMNGGNATDIEAARALGRGDMNEYADWMMLKSAENMH